MAHVVLEQRLADAGLADRVEVTSSGTGDWHVGEPMDRRAAATLTAAGYDATRHRARQYDPAGRRRTTWSSRWTRPTSPTSAARDRPGPAVPRLRPGRPGRRRTRPVLRWGRRLRGGADDGRTDRRPRSSARRCRATWLPAMTRQPLVARRAEELLGTSVVATAPVAGGDIATATRLRLSDGTTALMKTLPHAPEDFFAAEARGLRWLGEATAASPCPEVLGVRPRVPDHPVGRARQDSRRRGRRVRPRARRHPRGRRRRRSALERDGYIGKLPLPNRPRRHLGGVLRRTPGAALPQAGPRPRRWRPRRTPRRSRP